MHPIFERFKERKIVQWALAYAAGAWLVTQVLDTVAGPWGLSDGLLRSGQVALMLGLLVTLVLAWYHGERGRQRVSGPELLIIGGILGVGAVAVSFVGVPSAPPLKLDALDLEGVAVLPFETFSGTGEDRAFAEGLHFSLINTLERTVGDMTRVMARQAVLPYRDPTITADSIGRALAVEHLLYGAAHRVGDEVRLSIELVDVASGDQLWSDELRADLSAEAVFDMQESIIARVAGALGLALRNQDAVAAGRAQTDDARAFELYVRALADGDYTVEDVEALTEAVERDPDFVAAHAALAQAHSTTWQYQDRTMRRDSLAHFHARRALELEPDDPDAWMAMAWYLYRTKRWEEALQWADDAPPVLRRQLDYVNLRWWTARRLSRWEEALAGGQRAVELNPLGRRQHGMTLHALRRYQEAIHLLERGGRASELGAARWQVSGDAGVLTEALPLSATAARWLAATYQEDWEAAASLVPAPPTVWSIRQGFWYPAELVEGWTLERLGRDAEARAAFGAAVARAEDGLEEEPRDARRMSALALAQAGLGQIELALENARRAVASAPTELDALEGPSHLFHLSAVQASAGDLDTALATLAELLDKPWTYTPLQIEHDLLMRPLRNDPRFLALMGEHRNRVF